MNKNNILFLMFAVLFLFSCKANKEYEKAVNANSIPAYEIFKTKHPKSKHKLEVEKRLYALYDEQDWIKAASINTVQAYEYYKSKYSQGRHVLDAIAEIDKLKKKNALDEAWNKSIRKNTIEGYESFLNFYPKSEYTLLAFNKISALSQENVWSDAVKQNTTASYRKYLQLHPQGKYANVAKTKIANIEEENRIKPIWEQTIRLNTLKGYTDFLRSYPQSSYAKDAEEFISNFEELDWSNARKVNTVKAYDQYVNKYPYGNYVEIAEKKKIDLEVDKIFQGGYGQLPPMNRSSFGYTTSSTSEIEVHNDTKYKLTLRYSGSESKKIILSPHQRTTVTLKNGNYRIAASVEATNVKNYGGNVNLAGDKYSSKYYIVTETYRSFR